MSTAYGNSCVFFLKLLLVLHNMENKETRHNLVKDMHNFNDFPSSIFTTNENVEWPREDAHFQGRVERELGGRRGCRVHSRVPSRAVHGLREARTGRWLSGGEARAGRWLGVGRHAPGPGQPRRIRLASGRRRHWVQAAVLTYTAPQLARLTRIVPTAQSPPPVPEHSSGLFYGCMCALQVIN